MKAYLSTIKDSSTNENVAYHVSDRITMDLATDTLLQLIKNPNLRWKMH
jgi:putative transposase